MLCGDRGKATVVAVASGPCLSEAQGPRLPLALTALATSLTCAAPAGLADVRRGASHSPAALCAGGNASGGLPGPSKSTNPTALGRNEGSGFSDEQGAGFPGGCGHLSCEQLLVSDGSHFLHWKLIY